MSRRVNFPPGERILFVKSSFTSGVFGLKPRWEKFYSSIDFENEGYARLRLYRSEEMVHRVCAVRIQNCEIYDAVASQNRPLTIRIVPVEQPGPRQRIAKPFYVSFDSIESLDNFKAELLNECCGVFRGGDPHVRVSSKMLKFLFGHRMNRGETDAIPRRIVDKYGQTIFRISRKDVSEWNKNDVIMWLDLLGFLDPQFSSAPFRNFQIFRENDIDGRLLVELDKQDLMNLGVVEEDASKLMFEVERIRRRRKVNFPLQAVESKLMQYPQAEEAATNDAEWFDLLSSSLSDVAMMKHYLLNTAELRVRNHPVSGIVRVVDLEGETVEAFRSGQVRFKLIMTESRYGDLDIPLRLATRGIVSPATHFPEGLSRLKTAVVVGPWYLEFSDSGLCLPKRLPSGRILLSTDVDVVCSYPRKDEEAMVRDRLATMLVQWNTCFSYGTLENREEEEIGEREDRPGDRLARNCQMFVDAVFAALGGDLSPTGAKRAFIDHVRRQGSAGLHFVPSPEFREYFSVQETEIEFETHIQLDQMCGRFRDQCLDVYNMFADDWSLLKSYDRVFWTRHLHNPDDAIFQPLPVGVRTLKPFDTACPFGDPRNVRGY